MSPETPNYTKEQDALFLPENLDLTCGGKLKHEGHRIRKILHKDENHLTAWESSTRIIQALNEVGYSKAEIPKMLYRLAKVFMSASVAHDTEIICNTDEYAESVIMEFIDRFVTEESKLHGQKNLLEAMELNRKGESVQFYCMPHQSALDPIFLKILLQREVEDSKDDKHKIAAQHMLEQLIVLIGHKVLHSRFRRAFSQAVNAIFTVSPKYRADLKPKEKELLTLHSNNVGKLIEVLRKEIHSAMLIFPEGGFTENKEIGIQAMTAHIPSDTHIVPIFMNEPYGFLRPELGPAMHMEPSKVDIYFGKPFQIQEGGNLQRLQTLVTTCQNNLAAENAPVRDFKWGYMKRNRSAESGQEFRQIST